MKNFEKYKTAEDRVYAFHKFCQCRDCSECPLEKQNKFYALADCCMAFWLELEDEDEKPLPCPFCGRDTVLFHRIDGMHGVYCTDSLHCNYESGLSDTESEAIAAHNQVAKAAMESKNEVANV